MNQKMTIDELLLKKLVLETKNEPDLSVEKIYSLFSEVNPKTVLWRLHKLVQQGKLYRTGRGNYSIRRREENIALGYDYLQNQSKEIYDIASEFGYNFYITGLDALTGELVHIPERYVTLLVIEKAGMEEIQEVLNNKGYFAILENDRETVNKKLLQNKIDVIILSGKNFELEKDRIAIKEKGFIDLYFAVTRLDYAISIQELSRIYENMQRNATFTKLRLRQSAKDRGLTTEINWLLELRGIDTKILQFMNLQVKETT